MDTIVKKNKKQLSVDERKLPKTTPHLDTSCKNQLL